MLKKIHKSGANVCKDAWKGGGGESWKLFIGLAFHTIFVIFLSAQTDLIIIIFYMFMLLLPLPHSVISWFCHKIYFPVFPLHSIYILRWNGEEVSAIYSNSLKTKTYPWALFFPPNKAECAWVCEKSVIESNESTVKQEAIISFAAVRYERLTPHWVSKHGARKSFSNQEITTLVALISNVTTFLTLDVKSFRFRESKQTIHGKFQAHAAVLNRCRLLINALCLPFPRLSNDK